MERRALIIECSQIPGQDRLPGAVLDADAWHKYLYSARGGDWFNSEIEILRNPSPSVVRQKLREISSFDYGFVAFSGHGYVSASTGDTMACLLGGELSDREMTPGCDRSTLIMDSCRGVFEPAIIKASLESLRETAGAHAVNRKLFDDALAKAEKGACRIYGCAFEQAAEEMKAGGRFTHALVQAGLQWKGKGVFTLREAFDVANATVLSQSGQQTPESQLGRRLYHFPFAVQQ